jgi:predicted dehydrogenase
LRRSGAHPERIVFEAFDSLRGELEAFADAIERRAPFSITPQQALETVEAFEAITRALQSGSTITVVT